MRGCRSPWLCLWLGPFLGLALVLAGAGGAAAQAQPSPRERLRAALTRASQDGSLERALGEHTLLSDKAAYLLRVQRDGRHLLLELETRFLAPGAPLFHDALSLSSTGEVSSFSCALWLPGLEGKEVRVARDPTGALRWEVFATRGGADPGRSLGSGAFVWEDDQLPYLALDFLWPLIGEEGTLTCRRVGLLRQPAEGQSPLVVSPARAALERRGEQVSAAIAWGKSSFLVLRSPGGRLMERRSLGPGGETWRAVTGEQFRAAAAGGR